MKKQLIILAFTSLSLCIYAQNYKKPVAFQPDIYAGFTQGLNSYWAEGISNYMLHQPLNSLGSISRFSLGYHFTPEWSVRGIAGYTTNNWPDNSTGTVVGLSAVNIALDGVWDITNTTLGYEQNRAFNLGLFAGVGAGYRMIIGAMPSLITPLFRGGLQSDIKLSPELFLQLSGELNIVTDAYNGDPVSGTDGTPVDIYPALTIGLNYRIPMEQRGTIYRTHYR